MGLSELLSRYSWKLPNVVKSLGGLAYLCVNGGVAVVAYLAAVEWGLDFGLKGRSEAWRVLVVSICAMGIFRSSFANLHFDNREFAAGFAAFVEVFKRRAEKALHQTLAVERLGQLAPVIEGLTYAGTKDYICALAEGVVKSLSVQETERLQSDVAKIDQLEVDDATKMQLFAWRIVDSVGHELFVRFAQEAKRKRATANDEVVQRASDRVRRFAEIRKRLTK